MVRNMFLYNRNRITAQAVLQEEAACGCFLVLFLKKTLHHEEMMNSWLNDLGEVAQMPQ